MMHRAKVRVAALSAVDRGRRGRMIVLGRWPKKKVRAQLAESDGSNETMEVGLRAGARLRPCHGLGKYP